MEKKTRRRDEVIERLAERDTTFRRLYDRVVATSGGRVPTSEEIGDQLERRVARRESS